MTKLERLAAFCVCLASAALVAQDRTPISDYPIRPVPIADVRVTGGFWAAKIETNRTVTIPHILRQNEKTGRVDDLRRASRKKPGDSTDVRFGAADVYTIIEAASFSLASHPDPSLQKKVDELVAIIAAAQQPDSSDLHSAGHLFEAAVALYRAAGERTLLDVARRSGDLAGTTYGPGAQPDAPGHEEAALGLVKLYRATGDRRYLDLSRHFLNARGLQPSRAQGHAVRAMYLYSAMTDIAAMFRDPSYDRAVDRLWQDVVSKRIDVAGGVGSSEGGVFGDDYALANAAGADTCASAGAVLWNYRMFQKSGDAKYLDALEQTLYNSVLSGVSIEGDRFLAGSPLESNGRIERSPYFEAACAPANLSRLIAELPGLVYSTRVGPGGPEVFVNLYAASDAAVKLDAATLRITQTTTYPWDGRVAFRITSDRPVTFTLKLRVPGWLGPGPFASDLYTFTGAAPAPTTYGAEDARISTTMPGWVEIRVPASSPDERGVAIAFPMPVRRVQAHSGVKDAAGKSAIERGPILYALEGVDHGGRALDVGVPADQALTPVARPDLLGGVTVLTATGKRAGAGGVTVSTPVMAIPYFAWANRRRGEMVVWVKEM